MHPAEREFARRVGLAVGIGLLLIALAVAAVRVVPFFLLVFAALLVAAVLRGIADWVAAHTRLGPNAAFAAVVLFWVMTTALAVWSLAPAAVEEGARLSEEIPRLLRRASGFLRRLGIRTEGELRFGPDPDVVAPAVELFGSSVRAVIYLLVIVVLALYLAADPGYHVDGFVRLFPPSRRDAVRALLADMGRTVQVFMLARLISMAAVGLLTGLGLWLFGVPSALLLGTVAAVLTFVPYAGPLAAGVPIAALALAESPTTFLLAVGYYTIVQSVEGFLITPLVEKRAVALPPVITIGSQFLLGLLFGPVGVVLSAPLAAALRVMVLRIYVERFLERSPARAPGTER